MLARLFRTVHVPHAYFPAIGGAETLVRRVSSELVARGHEVHVVVPDLVSAEGLFTTGVASTGRGTERLDGVWVQRIPLGRSVIPARHAVRVERLLRREVGKAISSQHPDVVMTLPHLLPNVTAVLNSISKHRAPVVMVPLLHEDDPSWPVDDLKQELQRAAAVIALTDTEASRLLHHYGVDSSRIFVSGLGVDLMETPAEGNRPPTVLFLGRLAPSKNLGLLVQSMRYVWAQQPETTLVIAGSSIPGVTETVLLTEGLSPQEASRVEIRTDVDDHEKSALLAQARCLVSPSIRESFGLVLLEAMANGTPVIAMDTPVNREIVPPDTGVLTVPEAAAVGGAILGLIESPRRAQEMGSAAKAHVGSRRRWSTVTDTFEAAYVRAMEKV